MSQPKTKTTKSSPQTGMLEERPGRTSAMRVMSMIALVAAIVFGGLVVTGEGEASGPGVYIVFGFLLAAFAPKALQKFAENSPIRSRK